MPSGTPSLPDEADVVIIGGGITGCASAYNLAAKKVSVVLLERGAIAGEQSSRAWGFIRKQGRHPAEVPLAAEASRMWAHLQQELQADIEFVREGILAPAETEADEAAWRESVRIAAMHGLSTRLLSAREVQALLPEMKGNWRAGLYTPDDGHAEPRKATEAFAAAATRRGAKLFPNTGVTGVELTSGRVSAVHTRHGTVRAGAVLCAAGLGTAAIARSVGISLPIHAIRLPVVETEKTTPFTRLAVWAPDVALRPTARNTFYIGSGFHSKSGDLDVTLDALRHFKLFLPRLKENQRLVNIRVGAALLRSFAGGINSNAEAEPAINDEIVERNTRGFRERFPHLGDLGIMRRWAGRTDVTPDMIPIIGALPGVANFYVAAGYSGHGFALGPVSGKVVSELMLTGRSSIDISAFRPSRFAEGDLQIVPRYL